MAPDNSTILEWGSCLVDNCTDQTVYDLKKKDSLCNTVENEICKFPFKYSNATHHKCTTIGNNGKLWCSTRTDETAHHVAGRWGNCEEKCPTCLTGEKNQACKFPFTNWNGITYSSCTRAGGYGDGLSIDPWCIPRGSEYAEDCTDDNCPGNIYKIYNKNKKNYAFYVVGCHTSRDAPCIFPFHFNGSEYNQCTGVGSERPGKTWCAIKVKSTKTDCRSI